MYPCSDREIRVSHISKVDDPNEELLHWVDAMELSKSVYSANTTTTSISTAAVVEGEQRSISSSSLSITSNASHSRGKSRQRNSSTWDLIAVDAFFQLMIDTEAKAHFLSHDRGHSHDELLVETLEELLSEQNHPQDNRRTAFESSCDGGSSDWRAVRVTFIDTLERIIKRHPERPLSDDTRAKVIRNLRKTYAVLRNSGLLFLEDDDSDRHVLLTFEFALKPALLQMLRGSYACFLMRLLLAGASGVMTDLMCVFKHPLENESGMTEIAMTERVVTQRKFQRLPLEWLEISLQRLLQTKLIMKRENSQRFHLASNE